MLADALRDRLPATAEAFDEETVALTDAETAAVDALAAVLAAAEAKPPQ
jgi:hypothetical protein